MSQDYSENYEGWGIVELMGHRKLAGKLSTQKVGGAYFLRIDIPAKPGTAVETDFQATQFINPTSIYAMHPTTEEVARAVSNKLSPEPVTTWDVKALMPGPVSVEAEGGPRLPNVPPPTQQGRYGDSLFVDGTYDEDDDEEEDEDYE